MPKSRGRKSRRNTERSNRRKISKRTREILLAQQQRFREKFGRDWGENDPVFFDPEASEPVPMSGVKIEATLLEAMRKANTPPQVVYAYKKTGLLFVEGVSLNWPADRKREWEEAIDEYFAIEEASKGVDRPDPEVWSTEIPEMLAAGFDKDDLRKVREILAALAPIEGGAPMTVVARVELAAAFLATACGAAYDSAAATGFPDQGSLRYDLAEALAVKRAREIYGQGRG